LELFLKTQSAVCIKHKLLYFRNHFYFTYIVVKFVKMKNSKLQELFLGFSDKKYKKAREFLNSPYFNKNPNFALLLDYIETFKKNELPDKEQFYSYIIKNKLTDSSNLRVFVSQFTKLIQSFLETEELIKKPLFRKTFLLNVLNRLNAQKSFSMILNELRKKNGNAFSRDEDYYYNQMYIELEELNFRMMRDNNLLKDNIKNVSTNLDMFFILAKLNLLHFTNHFEKDFAIKINDDIWLQKEMEKYLSKNFDSLRNDHPVIYAKYLILLTIVKPENIENFQKLKEFGIVNSHSMHPDILEYIFTALMNYAITKINSGNEAFGKEALELFFLMERFEIISNTPSIDYTVFLNIISTFVTRGDIDNAEKFYEKYCDKIIPFFREDTSNLALAAIEHHKGNIDQAIRLLNVINYKSYYFYLRSKALLSKILFESGDFDSIIYLCDATKHYLKRNKEKISQSLFTLYFHYFSFTEKIVNLKIKQPMNISAKKTALIKTIKKEKVVTSKSWLLEKAREVS
jgi:hypothetical protein